MKPALTSRRLARARWGILVACLSMLLGCGGGGGPPEEQMAQVVVRVYWPAEEGTERTIPQGTTCIEVTVSAADISPPMVAVISQEDIHYDVAEVSFRVPPGTNRLITAQAKDVGGVVLAEGSATVEIIAGQTTQVNIMMIEGAQLSVAPTTLDFGLTEEQMTFEMGNTGDQQLDWTLSIPPEATWATADPMSGSAGIAGRQTVTVSVDRTGLPTGDYTTQMTITSNGGDGLVTVQARAVYGPKIAFVREGDVYLMDTDGTNVQQLTAVGSVVCVRGWSPNGATIFFQQCGSNPDIWAVKVDGSGLARLTDDPQFDGVPSLSRDGSKIAFMSNRDGNQEIYVMNSDGSNEINLTNNPAYDGIPNWSPDGGKIAFDSDRDGNWEIYVMNADGTNQTRLTDDPAQDWRPHWYPDGTKILFGSGDPRDLYVMNPDGSNCTALTSTPDARECPSGAWSPDGTSMTYTSCVSGKPDIFAMDITGENGRQVTTLGNAWGPDWSPDGAKIAFSAGGDIYTVHPDGSNLVQLTSNPENERMPKWRPLPFPVGSVDLIVQ